VSREDTSEEVEEVYKELFKEDKWKEKAGYLLGKVYEKQGKFDIAIPYLEEVIFVNPYNEKIYILLGELYYRLGNFDLAKKRLNKAIQLNPKISEGYYLLGLVESAQHNKMLSIDLLNKALEQESKAEYISGLAAIHHDIGKKEEAKQLMKKAIKLSPDILENHFLLGLWYFEEEEHERAKEYFQYCIENEKKNQKYQIYYNRNLAQMRKYQDAIENLSTLPKSIEVLIEMGKIFLLAGSHDEAKSVYSEAVSIEQNCIEAREALGVMYFDIDKNFTSASGEFDQILSMDENHQIANLYMGRMEYTKDPRNYQAAIRHWERVEHIDDAMTKFAFGHSYFEMKNFSKSLATLLKLNAIEFNPDCLVLLGKIYEELGDYQSAFKMYKKIIDNQNKYENAWYSLAELTDRLNQIDDSRTYYTYIISNIKKDPFIYKRLGELFIYYFGNNKFSIEAFERFVELQFGKDITKVPKDLVRIISLVYLKERDFQSSRNYAATLAKKKDFSEYLLSINNYQMKDWGLCYEHLNILSEKYSTEKWFIPYQISVAEVLEYLNKPAEALKIFENLFQLFPNQDIDIYFRFAHLIENLVKGTRRDAWVHSKKVERPKKIEKYIEDTLEEVIRFVEKSKLTKQSQHKFSSELVYMKILAEFAIIVKDFSFAKKKFKIISKIDNYEAYGKFNMLRSEFLEKAESYANSKKEEDYSKYEKELLKLMKEYPDNYDGYLLKFDMKKKKDKTKGVELLKDAYSKIGDPQQKMNIFMLIVEELISLKDYEGARLILNDILNSAPQYLPAIVQMTRVNFNLKRYEEVLKNINQLPFIVHLEEEFFNIKLVSNFMMENYCQIMEQFVFTDFSLDSWIEDKAHFKYYPYVAFSLYKLGALKKSLEIFEKMMLKFKNEEFYIYYSEVLEFNKNNDKAHLALLEGLKEFPNSTEIKVRYLQNLMLMDKYPDAESFLNSSFDNEQKANPRVQFFAAKMKEKLKDYQSAERILNNIRDTYPEKAILEEYLGHILIKENKLREAIDVFQSVRQANVDKYDMVKETLIPNLYPFAKDPLSIERIKLFEKIKELDYLLINLYEKQKRTDEYEDTLKSLIDRFPDDISLYYRIIKLKIDKNDPPKEIMMYINSILDFAPDELEAKYYKAFINLKFLKEAETALDLMKEVVSKKEETKYLMLMGEIYLELDQSSNAVDIFSTVVEKEPDNYKIYKLLSEIEYNSQNYEKSLDLVSKGIDLGLNKDEVLEQMANIYLNLNKYEEAIAVCEEILDKGIGKGNIHSMLGAAYLMIGNNVKAQNNLMRSIELDQDAGECFFKMGEIFLKQKKFKQSIKTLEKSIEKNYDNQNLHFYLGVSYFNLNETDKAQREFEVALQEQRDDYFVHKYLGDIYFIQKKYSKAAIEYSRAREIDTKKTEIYEPLSKAYLNIQEFEKVIELIDYIIKFEKQNINLYLMKCSAFFEMKKYEDAEKIISQVIKVEPNNIEVLNLAGKILFAKEQVNEALKYFEKSLQIDPGNFEALKYSGIINLNKFRLRQAEENLIKSQFLKSDDAEIPLLLGNIFMKTSKWIDAIIQFRKAIKLNPTSYEAYIGLGDIYQFKQRWNEAIEEYEKVLSLNYYLPNIHFNLGRLYEKIGNGDKAEQFYRQTIRMDPENYSGMEKLGLLLISDKRYNEALTFIINALTKEHDNVKIMIQLFECYRNLDQLDQAKKILQQANELAPDDFEVIKSWGDYYLDIEDLKNARKSYEALVLKDNEYVPALLKLGHIYTGLKEYEKAEELYKKIIKMTKARKDTAFYGLGYLYEEKGDNEMAIQWYLRSISENNQYLDPLLRLGNIYFNENNYIRAVDYWVTAIKQGIDDSNVFYYLGKAYLNLGENIKALNIFEEGKKRQDELQFNYGLIEAYISMEQYELAIELLKRLKLSFKDDSELLHKFFSKVYLAMEIPNKAIMENYILFKQGIEPILSMFNVAKIYIKYLDRPQAGNYILEKLIKGDPDNPDYYTYLLESYRKLQNYGKAKELASDIDKFEEKSAELYVVLGRLFEDLNDKKAARDAYINALNINPHLEEIQDKLGNI
ncbi:MAG: tetratricopeptide repeat protein, partial [bacterium]|nr:tetratricopeptide repeat protein [bacterium]